MLSFSVSIVRERESVPLCSDIVYFVYFLCQYCEKKVVSLCYEMVYYVHLLCQYCERDAVPLCSEIVYFVYLLCQYREREAVRLCLKHFRQQNYSEAFESLQKRTRVELEHSVLTQLHGALVERGDFLGAEQVLEQAADDGLFSEFIGQHQSKPLWTPILPAPGADRPGMRGGHQVTSS